MAIFISYAREDYEIVNRIAEDLVRNKYYIWIDKWQLNYGDSLSDKIRTALVESSVVMIMISKNSVQSDWCKRELDEALNNEIQKKRSLIFPVLLERCDYPDFLKDKLGADFTDDYQLGLQGLLKNLLKFTDIDLNRVESKEFITDFSISYGLDNNLLHFNIDSVSFADNKQYSVLCSLQIVCNPIISQQYYMDALLSNKADFLLNDIICNLFTYEQGNSLKTKIIGNMPIYKTIDINLKYKLSFCIKRLGYNNGYDIYFDYGSILRMMYEKRKSMMKY